MDWVARVEGFLNKHIRMVGAIIAVCGFAIRLYYASQYYLNTDEALHYTTAAHPWHGLVGLYLNATKILHPPLLIVLLQPISADWPFRGTAQACAIILRSIVPVVCHALGAENCRQRGGALRASVLAVAFSPMLIDLGAEIRAYTLAFLFFSVCLLFLEKSLESGSTRSMIWFSVFLYLAMLSEYSVAWFMAAAGIYAILRLWKRPASGRLFLVWALGQLVALGLYLFLYKTHISQFSRNALEENYTTWLQPGFPLPHQNILRFAVHGTMNQFRYMFQLRALVWAAAIAFVFGLYFLWRRKSPSYSILMVLPFCFACLGAIFPSFSLWPLAAYGNS